MDAFTDFFPDLLVGALLLLAALGLAPVAGRLRLPGPAAFLAVGVTAGALGWLPTDIPATTLEQLGALALYGILFHGGVQTGFRAWRREARSIVLLGTLGTAATAAVLVVAGHYLLGLGWELAVLVAVALSPTDPAAVYATLRGDTGSVRPRVILEGESGFNDPVSISLMVVAVSMIGSDGASLADGVVHFAKEMGIGLAGGVAGAALLVGLIRLTPRLDDAVQGVVVLVGAVIVGAGTATLHGSGFLAVYVAALLVADVWAEQDGAQHVITESASAVAEPLLFGLLGAAFVSEVTGADIVDGIALTLLTVVLIRPAVVLSCLTRSGLDRRELAVVSVGGLKGAVPLLLAGYTALEALPHTARTEAIVLCATAASILLQAPLLSAIGRGSHPR